MALVDALALPFPGQNTKTKFYNNSFVIPSTENLQTAEDRPTDLNSEFHQATSAQHQLTEERGLTKPIHLNMCTGNECAEATRLAGPQLQPALTRPPFSQRTCGCGVAATRHSSVTASPSQQRRSFRPRRTTGSVRTRLRTHRGHRPPTHHAPPAPPARG
ncbi:Protein of unknown function [Gryllus bimaculatus]|nr:Protein of unknown function [Gryllus bimaculatus]